MIKNKKSKIIGSDTHALGGADPTDTHSAGLSGAVSASLVKSAYPAPTQTGSCAGGQTDWQTIATLNYTITNAINELYIHSQAWFSLSSSNAMQVRLVRDGATGSPIASMTTAVATGGSWILPATIINESVGAHTYIWQIKNTVNPGETSCVFNQTTFHTVAYAVDSHAGVLSGSAGTDTHVLSGSNNQSTRANGIIQ